MNSALQAIDKRDLLPPALIGILAATAVLLPSPAALAAAVLLLAAPLAWFVLLHAQRWLSAFFLAALLLPPLPVALGNSGPHVAVFIAALGIPAGLLRLGDWRIRMAVLPASLAFFFAVLLGSTGLAFLYSGWTVGAGSLARVLLFGIACYVYFYAAYGPVCDPRRLTRLLFLAAAGSALFACLDFQFQWPAPAGFGAQFIWLDTGVFRRAQGFFYEASTLGNFCVFFLTMAALRVVRPKHETPVSRLSIAVAVPLLATALLLSYSRASLVNLGVSLAVMICLHRPLLHARRWVRAALFFAGTALLAFGLFSQFVTTWMLRLWLSVQYFFSSPNSVLSGRLESWQRLGGFLLDHPWHLLLGVGYKTLPYSDLPGGPITADNMYLGLLAETGIAGLAAFLALNAAILHAAWRARHSFFGAWIFCFWTGQLVQMLSGDLLTYWRVMPVYFWVLGQAVRVERR
ncbi:MAG: O-antigen ligase family protein [Bryobacteraceae bacterium]|nr:O-antigen ligase family protein [Bryobacteraceae bacterium]